VVVWPGEREGGGEAEEKEMVRGDAEERRGHDERRGER
jgi:hypothetical protein